MPNITFKPDTRDRFWGKLERDIQKIAYHKEPQFSLRGPWKKYLRRQEGFKVYQVDGDWVRSNLSVIFGHGGHGFVHEFIPLNEIWVDKRHASRCGCRRVPKDRHFSTNYRESTIIHEIQEFLAMQNGTKYWQAHQKALQKEIEAGFLRNPYREV